MNSFPSLSVKVSSLSSKSTDTLSSTEITDEELQQRINLREKQLEDLGVKYDELFVCIGKTTHEVAMQKAEVCRIQKPVIIFEDTPMYVAVIEQRSKTIGLLVTKIK